MAARKIDSHQHFWKVDRGDYHWMGPGLEAITRDFFPPELAPIIERHGVEKTVLIQAADTAAEAEFLFDLAAEYDFIAGGGHLGGHGIARVRRPSGPLYPTAQVSGLASFDGKLRERRLGGFGPGEEVFCRSGGIRGMF